MRGTAGLLGLWGDMGYALGHDVDDWEIVRKATCSREGIERGVCKRCGKTVSQPIEKLDHEPGSWKVSEDFSVTPFGTVVPETEVRKCKVCGEVVDEREYTIDLTYSQKNALMTAANYLETMPFSKEGLVDQLEFEGYSNDDARFAAAHCGANWKEQAALTAASYLETMPFSRSGLID